LVELSTIRVMHCSQQSSSPQHMSKQMPSLREHSESMAEQQPSSLQTAEPHISLAGV